MLELIPYLLATGVAVYAIHSVNKHLSRGIQQVDADFIAALKATVDSAVATQAELQEQVAKLSYKIGFK